jgi:outer membrane protein TolC
VLHRAVANNMDIRVAGYGPAINSAQVVEAEARFDPSFFANVQYQYQNNQTPGTGFTNITGGPVAGTIISFFNKSEQLTFQSGIKQQLANGAQVELRGQMQRNLLSPRNQAAINPYVQDDIVLQVTQPLLKDFGFEVNRARIDIARNNQKVALLDFRKQVEESLSDLEQRYWQLAQAEEEVRIQERFLASIEQTGGTLERRFGAGADVSRIPLSQSDARAESARAVLIRDRAHVRDLSDQIKALMNDPDMPVAGPVLILPADAPLDEPLHFDTEDQIKTALENRFELAEQHHKIDNAAVTVNAAKNNMLPQLNLVGQVGTESAENGFDTALNKIRQINNNNFAVGFQFEVPIGNREARAIWQRTLLQYQQNIDQYRGLILQVDADVKQAVREVNTAWNEMVQTRKAVFANQDVVRGLKQRQATGNEPLTPNFIETVLNTEERLAAAERDNTQAIANYNIAIFRLERAKGTLLRYNNIMMEEEPFRRQYARP